VLRQNYKMLVSAQILSSYIDPHTIRVLVCPRHAIVLPNDTSQRCEKIRRETNNTILKGMSNKNLFHLKNSSNGNGACITNRYLSYLSSFLRYINVFDMQIMTSQAGYRVLKH
jgi:hypothetical protein